MSTLLPCPFCGHARPYTSMQLRDGYRRGDTDSQAYYTVVCTGCAAQVGWAKTRSGAERQWNRRGATLPPREGPKP